MKDEERYSVGMNMIEPIVLVREVRVRDFKNLIHLNLIFRTDLYSYSFFLFLAFPREKRFFFSGRTSAQVRSTRVYLQLKGKKITLAL